MARPSLPLRLHIWEAQHGILRSFGLNSESDDHKEKKKPPPPKKDKRTYLILVSVKRCGKRHCTPYWRLAAGLVSFVPRVTWYLL